MSEKSNPPQASMEQALVAGLLGAGVAVVCLIPPVVHFISGPLGPAIGGAVGGIRVRPSLTGALVIGLTIGVLLAVVVPVLGLLLQAFLPVSFPEEALLLVGLVVFVYSSLLGVGGAMVGAWFSRPDPTRDDGGQDQTSAS